MTVTCATEYQKWSREWRAGHRNGKGLRAWAVGERVGFALASPSSYATIGEIPGRSDSDAAVTGVELYRDTLGIRRDGVVTQYFVPLFGRGTFPFRSVSRSLPRR